jgi:hypothetical protein
MFVLRLPQPEYQSLNRLRTRPSDFTPPHHDARDVGYDGGYRHDRDGLFETERIDEARHQHDRRARAHNAAHSAGDEPDRQHEQEIHDCPSIVVEDQSLELILQFRQPVRCSLIKRHWRACLGGLFRTHTHKRP